MKRMKNLTGKVTLKMLMLLAALAVITAHVGCASASAWGGYQPELPEELER